jgi:hypothetical protein
MSNLKQLLKRLKTWREKRRLFKIYDRRAYIQSLDLLELQWKEEKRLQRRHTERMKLERKILRNKSKDDYVS